MPVPYKFVKKSILEDLQKEIGQKDYVIESASHFVKEIEKGNLDISFENDQEQTDSLQESLLSMRDQLKKISQDEKERNWATEGLAKFADILRKDNSDIKELSDYILSNLVKYMNVNQGALFILNEEGHDEPYLELVSCYAYNRKKFLQKKIGLGEGLVGQTFLEKETIYMTEIPDRFVTIGSGLGEARPTNILIVPLKVNENIFGVVELASFHTIKDYQQDFVERLGESIASTISSVRIASRTKMLLEESQQQAEEMRAQEEEVRQNMEELSATQEEMQRILKEVQGNEQFMNDLLDASIDSIISFDRAYKIILFNRVITEEYLSRGLSVEKGMSMQSLMDAETWAKYVKFYERAFAGETFEITESFQFKDSNKYYLTVYGPIRNERQEVVGAVAFGKDVTEAEESKRRNEELLAESQAQTAVLKEQEEILRENMEQLSVAQANMQTKVREIESRMSAIDNSGFASVEFNLKGEVIQANANFLELMGYSLEEIQGKHHNIFVSKEYAESDEYKQFVNNIHQGIPSYGEFDRCNKEGNTVNIKGSYTAIKDENGDPLRVILLATDITETKESFRQAQEQAETLQEQAKELQDNADEFEAMQEELSRILTDTQSKEHYLTEILNMSDHPVLTMDKEFKLISFNKAFEESIGNTGLTCESGMDVLSLSIPEERKSTQIMYEKVLTGETIKLEIHPPGLCLEVKLSPLKNPMGEITGIISHATDMTELYQLKQSMDISRKDRN